MRNNRIFINAFLAAGQVVVLSVIFFILYRYLLETIGIEQLGIWSLVLATTSVTRISSLGLSEGGVVRFVGKYIGRNDDESVAGVIQTAALSTGVFVGLTLLVVYPFAGWLLSFMLHDRTLVLALAILPFGLLSLWLSVITSVFEAGLNGYQRVDLRSILVVGGGVFHLFLCFMLTPRYGLVGLAYAHICRAGALLIGSWLLLKRQLRILPVIPYQWNHDLFREMIRYCLQLQVVPVAQMLFDPITKVLLTKFGGLPIVGYYGMASGMISKLRALIGAANRVLIPAIANTQEKEPEYVQVIYRKSCYSLAYITLPMYFTVMMCGPIISDIWIGHYESIFVLYIIFLAVGWLLNSLTVPAYIVNLGIGEPFWNTAGHIIVGVMNGGLGLLLGNAYGEIGVVTAWTIALVVGSSAAPISYHIKHQIPFKYFLPKQNYQIIIASGMGLLVGLSVYYGLNHILSVSVVSGLSILMFATIVILPIWFHPMRKQLVQWSAYAIFGTRN